MVNPEYIKRILQAMTDVLKPAGFRKKGKVFVAEREDVLFFVELFKDVGRSMDELEISICVGAFSPTLAQACVRRGGLGSKIFTVPPTSVGDCHWARSWPRGNRAAIASSEDAERVADETARYLHEFALQEFDKLTPASKLHDVLYAGHGGGNAINICCEQVLMEWAAAEGKTAYVGGKPLTKEDFEPVNRPPGLETITR